MNRLLEKQAISQIPELIAAWLESEVGEVLPNHQIKNQEIDLIQRTGGYTFVVEWKGAGNIALISRAIDKVRNLSYLVGNSIPVIAVPFMGEAGRKLCARDKISWLDLSGNAHIVAPGLRIHIEGKSNKFITPGRPKDIFAPKSSRISRLLLSSPDKLYTQRELALEAGIDEALVSRVAHQFEREGLIVRNKMGEIKPSNPNLLLDAWHEVYSFKKHLLIQGFVAQRTSDDVLRSVTSVFHHNNIPYAATGLTAAWLLTHFASFRINTFYLSDIPKQALLQELQFTRQDQGGNVWLVIPKDEGVFHKASEREGIQCVHPVQVYLDLKGHPERAKEAAEALRQKYLTWGNHAQ
jgi:hypothetical protein